LRPFNTWSFSRTDSYNAIVIKNYKASNGFYVNQNANFEFNLTRKGSANTYLYWMIMTIAIYNSQNIFIKDIWHLYTYNFNPHPGYGKTLHMSIPFTTPNFIDAFQIIINIYDYQGGIRK
jgi:hypothetical protein